MKHPFLMHTLELRGGPRFVGGDGPWLWDEANQKYLDFFCDVGTSSLGYASKEQRVVLSRLLCDFVPLHAPNLYLHTERDRAAERICRATGMDKVFFCNSGAEAAETAIKLARLYQYKRHGAGRHAIACHKGGFHGRTLATLAAGDGPPYHREGFGPLPSGFFHFPTMPGALDRLDELNEANNLAAVMLAPVAGNNDVQEFPEEWLHQLRAWCDETGVLLVFDEVQTGAGRSGTRYTYAEREGVRPDILTLGKGVAMGVPTGVCLARAEVAEAFTPGSHFSTFGGNPLCAAFVNGMLDWCTPENLVMVEGKGMHLKRHLAMSGWAKNVRGPGMLIAFDIDVDTIDFAMACLESGLLVGAFRRGPGTVKVTPPLNASLDDLQLGLALMDEAMASLAR
jgi:acetylornithine/N-succinyldiaminopimelate aminotransferase